jgi:hypothetical protein
MAKRRAVRNACGARIVPLLGSVATIGAAFAVVGSSEPPPASAGAARARFEGYAAGSRGERVHVVRRGFINDEFALVFRDHRRSGTRYRVCWFNTCWTRTTGPRGTRSVVRPPAPRLFLGDTATGVVRWHVAGRQVADWKLTLKIVS